MTVIHRRCLAAIHDTITRGFKRPKAYSVLYQFVFISKLYTIHLFLFFLYLFIYIPPLYTDPAFPRPLVKATHTTSKNHVVSQHIITRDDCGFWNWIQGIRWQYPNCMIGKWKIPRPSTAADYRSGAMHIPHQICHHLQLLGTNVINGAFVLEVRYNGVFLSTKPPRLLYAIKYRWV